LLLALVVLAPASYAAEDLPLKDPMRPYQAPVGGVRIGAAERTIEVSAILISPQRRIAVINGELYREGDLVEGAELVRIEAESVRLKRAGEETVVPLDASAGRQISEGDSAT
jgi:MSHA biogenesis protein MshK